jgi:hypothetical protein
VNLLAQTSLIQETNKKYWFFGSKGEADFVGFFSLFCSLF